MLFEFHHNLCQHLSVVSFDAEIIKLELSCKMPFDFKAKQKEAPTCVLFPSSVIVLHSCLLDLNLTLKPDLRLNSCDQVTLLNEIRLMKGKATHNTLDFIQAAMYYTKKSIGLHWKGFFLDLVFHCYLSQNFVDVNRFLFNYLKSLSI